MTTSAQGPCILGIDTAGPVIGVARVGGPGPADWSARIVRGADGLLTPAIAELLQGVDKLDAVAVSIGPGAFTSLRVGVAAALGVAVARGCPVVAVSSLEARAFDVDAPRVLALLDGRKRRAYAGLFESELVGPERDIDPEELLAGVPTPFVATGEGAAVWEDLIRSHGGELAPDPTRSAAPAVARLGLLRLDRAVSPEAVRLHYIRPSDAQPPKSLGKR